MIEPTPLLPLLDRPEEGEAPPVIYVDQEVLALGRILGTLQGLPVRARCRVLTFARSWAEDTIAT